MYVIAWLWEWANIWKLKTTMLCHCKQNCSNNSDNNSNAVQLFNVLILCWSQESLICWLTANSISSCSSFAFDLTIIMIIIIIIMTGVGVVFLQPMFQKANTSKRYSPVRQPALLRQALKPHQLSSVNWMSTIEHHGGGHGGPEPGEWQCSHLMKCVSAPASLLFDVVHKRVLFEPLPADSHLANFTLRVKGGILAGMILISARTFRYFCTQVPVMYMNRYLGTHCFG